MNILKLTIFYGSYIIVPYTLWFLYRFFVKKSFSKVSLFILFIGLVLSYARFIEPKVLLSKQHVIKINEGESYKTIKIALVSDMHWGLFNNGIDAKKIVKRLNKIEPDLSLIAGDLLYELKTKEIRKVLNPFKKIKHKIFAVTGNHDEGHPGPDYGLQLVEALEESGVVVINNRSVDLGKDINLLGISDLWANEFSLEEVGRLKDDKLNLILTHNPDMAFELQKNKPIGLIMAGHTHGGQVRLPFIYKKTIPCAYDFDYGLYKNKNSYKVFVTSGVGMVGLPFRFLIPPRIDVLELRY